MQYRVKGRVKISRVKLQGYFELLAWGAFLLPFPCLAQANCPWLNAATAAGVLGGPVQMAVSDMNKNSGDATCTFTRTQSPDNLKIRVITMANPISEFETLKKSCGPEANHLRAIGNEAIACAVPAHSEQQEQKVIGRIRNRAFIITLTGSTVPNGPDSPPDVWARKTERVAEAVVGILY